MKEYMMTQAEFCDKILHINARTYNPIERNMVQASLETAFKISNALNRKIEDIWYINDKAE